WCPGCHRRRGRRWRPRVSPGQAPCRHLRTSHNISRRVHAGDPDRPEVMHDERTSSPPIRRGETGTSPRHDQRPPGPRCPRSRGDPAYLTDEHSLSPEERRPYQRGRRLRSDTPVAALRRRARGSRTPRRRPQSSPPAARVTTRLDLAELRCLT
uniref:Uncharacterized protein n=1 Tax=Aegilops tauschii subsp. strangulata TaxID=200361 RepID=A0A453DBC5_AEGTS